jgi:membrane protein YdbS with pleckstrin-like domain
MTNKWKAALLGLIVAVTTVAATVPADARHRYHHWRWHTHHHHHHVARGGGYG